MGARKVETQTQNKLMTVNKEPLQAENTATNAVIAWQWEGACLGLKGIYTFSYTEMP